MSNARYFVELTQTTALIHQGNPLNATFRDNLKLSLTEQVEVKGHNFTLSEILGALIEFDQDWLGTWFDERGQLELGHYLYLQVFGDNSPDNYRHSDEPLVDIRIITDDENLSRLPWMLLACKGVFLSMTGWAIALAAAPEMTDHELAPSPKILMIAPEPEDVAVTEADAHIQEFYRLLSDADPNYLEDSAQADACHLQIVRTWHEYNNILKTFAPHIIYYYGHGSGDADVTRLLFEDDEHKSQEKPVVDLVAALHASGNPAPTLAYINCCQGDAGGVLGAGRQLSSLIPAVLTNRTIAFIAAARAQGIAFWRSLLLKGETPHQAVAGIRTNIGELNLSAGDTRWMTPVLHARYDGWQPNPPDIPSRLERDPHWQLKLDRVNQYGQVSYQTGQMLRERKPRAFAFLWYGAPDQGIDIFHERLTVELNSEIKAGLSESIVHEVLPNWPEELFDPNASFRDMMCEAFKVSMLDHITGTIRDIGHRAAKSRVLVYVRHKPVKSPLEFDPKDIELYLEWWNHNFVPLLPDNAHALLGISYEVKNPAGLEQLLIGKFKLDTLTLSNVTIEILNELEKVNKRDLRAFIQSHNIRLPEDLKEEMLDKILQESNGSYVKILAQFKEIESRAWREGLEKIRNRNADDKGIDYGKIF